MSLNSHGVHVCARVRTHMERERDRQRRQRHGEKYIVSKNGREREKERKSENTQQKESLGIVSIKYHEVPRTKMIYRDRLG